MKKIILTLAVLCACLFLLCGAAGAEGSSLQLPADLRVISDEAFAGTSIESVIIPDSIRIIGQGAFARTPNLLTIELPAGFTLPGTATKAKHPQLTAAGARTFSKPEAPDTNDTNGMAEDLLPPADNASDETGREQTRRADLIPGQQPLLPEHSTRTKANTEDTEFRSMRPQDRAELHDIRGYFP